MLDRVKWPIDHKNVGTCPSRCQGASQYGVAQAREQDDCHLFQSYCIFLHRLWRGIVGRIVGLPGKLGDARRSRQSGYTRTIEEGNKT